MIIGAEVQGARSDVNNKLRMRIEETVQIAPSIQLWREELAKVQVVNGI
jgi:hypothetical protein